VVALAHRKTQRKSPLPSPSSKPAEPSRSHPNSKRSIRTTRHPDRTDARCCPTRSMSPSKGRDRPKIDRIRPAFAVSFEPNGMRSSRSKKSFEGLEPRRDRADQRLTRIFSRDVQRSNGRVEAATKFGAVEPVVVYTAHADAPIHPPSVEKNASGQPRSKGPRSKSRQTESLANTPNRARTNQPITPDSSEVPSSFNESRVRRVGRRKRQWRAQRQWRRPEFDDGDPTRLCTANSKNAPDTMPDPG